MHCLRFNVWGYYAITVALTITSYFILPQNTGNQAMCTDRGEAENTSYYKSYNLKIRIAR